MRDDSLNMEATARKYKGTRVLRKVFACCVLRCNVLK